MSGNRPAEDTHRLFFALWPDETIRCAVASLARRLVPDGRRVPAENLHVTLAFLGDADAEARQRVLNIGGRLTGAGFDLELDRIGCWPRRRISWIAPSHTPATLSRLHRELRQALRKAGFPIPGRRFVPHMTLARRTSPHAFHNVTPVIWPVDRVTLVRSHLDSAGARYEVLCEWPLQLGNTRAWAPNGGGTPPGNMK